MHCASIYEGIFLQVELLDDFLHGISIAVLSRKMYLFNLLASLQDSSSSNWAMAELIIGAIVISIYCWSKPPLSNIRPSVTLSRAAGRGLGNAGFGGNDGGAN